MCWCVEQLSFVDDCISEKRSSSLNFDFNAMLGMKQDGKTEILVLEERINN